MQIVMYCYNISGNHKWPMSTQCHLAMPYWEQKWKSQICYKYTFNRAFSTAPHMQMAACTKWKLRSINLLFVQNISCNQHTSFVKLQVNIFPSIVTLTYLLVMIRDIRPEHNSHCWQLARKTSLRGPADHFSLVRPNGLMTTSKMKEWVNLSFAKTFG